MNQIFSFLVLWLSPIFVFSQVISPSAQEVSFSYEATFIAESENIQESAYLHYSHLFGLMHSSQLIEKFNLNPNKIGGIGAPEGAPDLKIKSRESLGQNQWKISYSAKGQFLLHHKVAQKLLKQGYVTLNLPLEMGTIYNERCTDSYYNTPGDYWYFWNPYSRPCSYLLELPHTNPVRIAIKETPTRRLEQNLRLDLLRGANDNGSDFLIYVIQGFASDSKDPEDAGRLGFDQLNQLLQRDGFQGQVKANAKKSAYVEWTKDLVLSNGKSLHVILRSVLVDSDILSSSSQFARFFKEAVETADVIAYLGHSGLGMNLDIPSLEAKAGSFNFNPKKRQIFFFDSCASYSYYLKPFSQQKTKAKIDIISNGLSSYFHTSPAVLKAFLKKLLDPNLQDISWLELLTAMEAPLRGGSYLLNVGGI